MRLLPQWRNMQRKFCIDCKEIIKNPKSIWQKYCDKCYNKNKEVKNDKRNNKTQSAGTS